MSSDIVNDSNPLSLILFEPESDINSIMCIFGWYLWYLLHNLTVPSSLIVVFSAVFLSIKANKKDTECIIIL